jgi:oligosaccharide repeat unit polymerase
MTALATLSRAPASGGTAVLVPTVPTRQISYRRAPRGLWWTTPIGSLLMVVPLSLLVAVQIPDGDYRYFYKVPRVISGSQAGLFLLAAGVLALGTLIPLAARPALVRVDRSRLPDEQLAVLRIAEVVAFRTTMLGYIFLAGAGIVRGARPANLLDAVTSQNNYSGQLKAQFAPIAGVTSFTQIGIAYVVVAGILLCHGRSSHLVQRLLIVLILGVARAFLLTERLALLELLVPLVAIGAANLRQRPRRGSWLPAAPLLALPLLMTIFGAFEYSRSWVFYRSRTTLSFPQFVVNRLAGYYATSYNNGALELAHTHTANRLPYSTFEALWTAPVISQIHLYTRLTGQSGPDLLNTILTQYGNPEFNNPGGLAVPLVDLGTVGGLLFFLVTGLLIGLAYRSWRSGNPVGLLVYPVLFTGLLELPRYLYWTQGRVFPALAFLLVVAGFMARSSRPRLLLSGASNEQR